MAHHPKNVLSQLFDRFKGEVLGPPGSLLRGVATKPPIGSIEAKIPAAAGGVLPTPEFLEIARQQRESWVGGGAS